MEIREVYTTNKSCMVLENVVRYVLEKYPANKYNIFFKNFKKPNYEPIENIAVSFGLFLNESSVKEKIVIFVNFDKYSNFLPPLFDFSCSMPKIGFILIKKIENVILIPINITKQLNLINVKYDLDGVKKEPEPKTISEIKGVRLIINNIKNDDNVLIALKETFNELDGKFVNLDTIIKPDTNKKILELVKSLEIIINDDYYTRPKLIIINTNSNNTNELKPIFDLIKKYESVGFILLENKTNPILEKEFGVCKIFNCDLSKIKDITESIKRNCYQIIVPYESIVVDLKSLYQKIIQKEEVQKEVQEEVQKETKEITAEIKLFDVFIDITRIGDNNNIYSIKRKSDECVFEIGGHTNYGIIRKIKLKINSVFIKIESDKGITNKYDLSDLGIIPARIKSYDGSYLEDKTKCFVVETCFTIPPYKHNIDSLSTTKQTNKLYFKSKKTALIYFNKNIKIFSYFDVLENLKKYDNVKDLIDAFTKSFCEKTNI
jgi:Txe/YoeB family toxin of Txe-Axe toxin-antitoxin module